MRFSQEVCEQLKHYVYKLIDPRTGNVFYVGKGQGNRVFQHEENAKSLVSDDEKEEDLKARTILDIKKAGLEVISVIHRHGMDKATAFEVESALIDVYPEALNKIAGARSEFGSMNAKQINELYEAEEADFDGDKCIIIKIRQERIDEVGSVYKAVRWRWRLNPKKANKADYVVASCNGIIFGVFVVDEEGWKKDSDDDERYFFDGKDAPMSVQEKYVRKRLPASYMKRGAQNPVRYSY